MYSYDMTLPEAQEQIKFLAGQLDFSDPVKFVWLLSDIKIISTTLKQAVEESGVISA